jgi:hypothetical protein
VEDLSYFALRAALRTCPSRERRLEEKKKTSRGMAKGKPPNPKMKTPSTKAAIAPEEERKRHRWAVATMPPANRLETSNWIGVGTFKCAPVLPRLLSF